jgi:hypothetical protein
MTDVSLPQMYGDLCPHSGGCDTYKRANQILEFDGSIFKEIASDQVNEVCRSFVRSSQTCYRSFEGERGI